MDWQKTAKFATIPYTMPVVCLIGDNAKNNNNINKFFILMRMKNHFSKMGKALLNVALLSAVGFTSCADDKFHLKDYEESTPSFLGQSIYHELESRGQYTTVLRLIDDLEYAEVLSKTGSKTLFVANDEAYAKFFADGGNPWGARSYDDLSKNQKRVLLNNSMLNNAYVLEMLANTEGGGKNLCLRQGTSATASDSVARWAITELPATQSKTEIDWFKNLREQGDSVYMALDATDPMMVHFIEGQLKQKSIDTADIAKIMGKPWIPAATEEYDKSFGFINDCRIIDGDIVCLNGYIHVLDKVLLAPGNMAEVIRTNGKTDLFSAMLDRFAAPYYNEQLTRQYKALNDIPADSVFEKRYISNRSQGGGKVNRDPNGETFKVQQFLPFDPGWNQYAVSSSTPKEQDMAAMFVPTDEAMIEYFVNGPGRAMVERYGEEPFDGLDVEHLKYNLYQIPLSLMHPLLENLMKDSFNESVPSKYLTIVNDAQDQMFNSYGNVDDFKKSIVSCHLANNGVVYVTNSVNPPAEYASVLAPVTILDEMKVVRTIVKADDNFIEGNEYNNAPLKQYFSTYLKAMQSNFSFFVPVDAGINKYGIVDPVSFSTQPYAANVTDRNTKRYYWKYEYDSKGSTFPIKATAYKYINNRTEDKMGSTYVSSATDGLSSKYGDQKRRLLIEMIDQHILVHDNVDGVDDGRTYYLSRSGAPVRLTEKGNADQNGNVGMKVEGGFQVMVNDPTEGNTDNDHVATVTSFYNQKRTNTGYGNGMTYIIDRPIQATVRSVYNHLNDKASNKAYADFYDLANPASIPVDLLTACDYFLTGELDKEGKPISMTPDEQNREKLKFHVFVRNTDNAGTNFWPMGNEQLVRFFNNYHYTVYVPTNEMVQQAKDKGLMTWKEIGNWVSKKTNKYKNPLSEEDKAKARTMITVLVNFVKYHFQDQSVFVDNVTATNQYQTSCIDNVTNSYLSLTVNQSPSVLSIKDRSGNTVSVVSSEANRNLLARDISLNARGSSAAYISNSSYAVIHQIDGYLNFNAPEDYEGLYFEGDPTKNAMPVGNFDFWNYATPEELNAYTAKYRLR